MSIGLAHRKVGVRLVSQIRVAILGATGYTAGELIQILLRHPDVQITALTTRQDSRPHVSTVHRQCAGRLDLRLENLSATEGAERADCVFCCLPHAASAESVDQILDTGTRVVDFSADFRFRDVSTYERWYDVTHPAPARVDQAVYGLPELYRSAIRAAQLVANPGCHPTTAILAIAPLLKAGLVQAEGIVIDSKTGVSGGGRTPKPAFHFPECNESIAPYGVGNHRHTPEIDQVLSDAAGQSVEVVFTPHLVPMDRGLLATCYLQPAEDVTEKKLLAELGRFYADEPFVRVVDHLPATKDTVGTNFCDITVRMVRGRAIVMSCLDNLVKGASGAAVQNFNLMHGLDETTALL